MSFCHFVIVIFVADACATLFQRLWPVLPIQPSRFHREIILMSELRGVLSRFRAARSSSENAGGSWSKIDLFSPYRWQSSLATTTHQCLAECLDLLHQTVVSHHQGKVETSLALFCTATEQMEDDPATEY